WSSDVCSSDLFFPIHGSRRWIPGTISMLSSSSSSVYGDEQKALRGSLFQEHMFFNLLTSLLHRVILALAKSSDDNVVCPVYHLITFIIHDNVLVFKELFFSS